MRPGLLRHPWPACALLCALLAVTSARAAGPHDDGGFLDDVPVVLSASRLSQPLDEAPIAMTVIDRQTIRESGAWDLSEVFRLVPGMYVAYHADRFYATDSTVAYHGLVTNTKSDRMQVLVDGRSVYSSLYGGVVWSDIPVALEDIERIEVVRGPAAASYGANSFAGVINIITSHPAELQGKLVSFSVANGRSEGLLRYGGTTGELSYRLTVAARRDQGEDADIRNATAQMPRWMVNKFDDKHIRQLNWRGEYQVNSQDSLEMQLGFNGGPRQMGEYDIVRSDDRQAREFFAMLHWRRALGNGSELSLQAFHAVESSSGTLIDGEGTHNGDVRVRRSELELQHSFAPSDTTRLVWGGSVRADRVYAPYILGVEVEYLWDTRPFDLARLFANLEWRARPDLVLNAGAMLEKNNFTGTDVSPRLAANWHFMPSQTLRLGFSRATRSPSVLEKVSEEYWRTSGPYPGVAPIGTEYVNSSELGYIGKIGEIGVDLRVFRDRFSDLIDVSRASARAGNMNAGKATVKGVEGQFKWKLSERTRLMYSVSRGSADSNDANGVIYSDSMPRTMQNMMLTHRFNSQWSASLLAYQTSKTHFADTKFNPAENRSYFIPGNRRWDGRLAYLFQWGSRRGELSLNVQNLADTRYFEYNYNNEVPGRVTRLSLRVDF